MVPRPTLRAECVELDAGHCVWPGCESTDIEMAHFRGIGMGGRESADDIRNVGLLCGFHHDLLDGRSHSGLRRELGILLTEYVAWKRERLGWIV